MKFLLSSLSLFCCISLQAQNSQPLSVTFSPLTTYSDEWNKPGYAQCNTAEKVSYMSVGEKNVIYILNLIRTCPVLFTNTVLLKYPERSGNYHLLNDTFYFQSLVKTLLSMKPAPLLFPDKDCYTSARCHAIQSGITGYVGHERKKAECEKKRSYNGECCDYGNDDPLDIVLSLLIDEGVNSLGHRSICLGEYAKVAVSVQPHKAWRYNTVIDFKY